MEKKNYVTLRQLAKEFRLPIPIVGKMVNRQEGHTSLPNTHHMTKVKFRDYHDYRTWAVDPASANRLRGLMQNLSGKAKEQIDEIRNMSAKEHAGNILPERMPLAPYRFGFHTFLGSVQKEGYIPTMPSDYPNTFLIKPVYDFATGKRLVDHIWAVIPDHLIGRHNLIDKIISFRAGVRLYTHKSADDEFSLTLENLMNIRTMYKDEVRKWYNKKKA